MLEQLKKAINSEFTDIDFFQINTQEIVFEERVKLKCFYCSNYNKKWTCPPKIPTINYQKIIKEEYLTGLILKITLPISKENFEEIRHKSTNKIHQCLGSLEKILYNNNYPLTISFIGGSCKLCKNGCHSERCANPGNARIPLEATGVNVIKTLGKQNISVVFPIKNTISRYGLLLWEEK